MKRVIRALDQAEMVMCAAFLLVTLAVLTYQVFTRYVLGSPSRMSEEIARYIYIAFVYLSMSYAERENAHIRIELLHKVFPKTARPVVLLVGELIFLGFAGLMTFICTRHAWKIYTGSQISLTLGINMGIVYAFIALGYLLLSVRILMNLLRKRYLPPAPETQAPQV